ncbi:hypothetical protein, partial [Rhizobium lusitanum]|uniref:hypothetical protein n=2 Tax=Rhizobium TaxID=379 RepID=UPI001FEFA164
WIVFPIFSSMVANLGERQEIPVSSLIAVLSGTVVLQASYWARIRWVAVCPPCQSIFVAHVVSFAARLTFLFGGVFFSTIFFRHLPEASSLPPLGQAVLRGVSIVMVLFGLFCYSTELERLAKAVEDQSVH